MHPVGIVTLRPERQFERFVKGNSRLSSFFVESGSSRSVRALKSTCFQVSGNSSDCTRQPVTYATVGNSRSSQGRAASTASYRAPQIPRGLTVNADCYTDGI